MSPTASNPTVSIGRGLHGSEEGMLSLASLFVVLAFLVLIGFLANISMVTSRKLETQNAADSAAYAAALELARGMNSITALNHLIGELTAVAIMIHTLGGDELYKGEQPKQPKSTEKGLEIAHDIANDIGPEVSLFDKAYTEAKKDIKVGGAIYDSRKQLKSVLTWAFACHAFGSGVSKLPFPYCYQIGEAIQYAAKAFEVKVYEECEILNILEDSASDFLVHAEEAIRQALIPLLYDYESFVIASNLPFLGPCYQANRAAKDMGDPNLAECSLYPLYPQLPVQKEPQQPQNKNKSQLMRATTPWVQWWRQSWMDFGKDYIILSRFACAVQNRTNQYTPEIVKNLREDNSIQLYILKDLNLDSSDKTREKWMSDSDEADKLFTVVGLAYRPAPNVFAPNIFRQENPDGLVCYAQAMFYNANPQRPDSAGDDQWQPIAGWDTLNWLNFDNKGPKVPEFTDKKANDCCDNPGGIHQPRIQLNWRCKLVPTTRLVEATASGGQFGKNLRRTWTTNGTSLSRTH